MSVREISDVKLAVMLAIGTALGSGGVALLDTFVLDAGTQKQTDVQLVELAIGILAKPLNNDTATAAPDTALRTWAVSTINYVADIQFDDEAKNALIDGSSGFDAAAISRIKKDLFGLGPTTAWPEPGLSNVIREPYVVVPLPYEGGEGEAIIDNFIAPRE